MNKVCFCYQGKQYEMTEDQIDAAYYYCSRLFRYDDARRQLDNFIYGCDPDVLGNDDRADAEANFMKKYNVASVDAYAKLDAIVSRYEADLNCNIDENTAWCEAIWAVLTGN